MNPCMPLWEHIADVEPHVFRNPATGEERIYVFGSHDTSEEFYCSLDYVLWSAPTEHLDDWTNHGVIYSVKKTDEDAKLAALFAPDACQGPDGRFYLFAFPVGAVSDDRNVLVSDVPEGPYLPYGRIPYLGDPAVLADEDGQIYVYNGGPGMSTPTVSRLAADMLTTLETREMKTVTGENIPNFFEASSIRKVGKWYVYIYSSARRGDPKYFTQTFNGLTTGYTLLEYCYSRTPVGPWIYGGILMDNGGEPLGSEADYYLGTRRSYYNGTIHGSIEKIKDRWYVFYHKNTNHHDFSRQTCMEPIEIKEEEDRLMIFQPEMTSQGAQTEGLDAESRIPAGCACYLTGGAYITDCPKEDRGLNPIVNITNGTVVGIRYLQFGEEKEFRIHLQLCPVTEGGKIAVRLDDPHGENLTMLTVKKEGREGYRNIMSNVGKISGKHGLYLVFYAENEREICRLNEISFHRI